jgi:hypothetical protein
MDADQSTVRQELEADPFFQPCLQAGLPPHKAAKKVDKQRMSKQKLHRPPGEIMKMEDRYYVQPLTSQVFLVRERMSVDEEPGPDDRIVRSFNFRHDAYMYVSSVNDEQRKLDKEHGHWSQRAT